MLPRRRRSTHHSAKPPTCTVLLKPSPPHPYLLFREVCRATSGMPHQSIEKYQLRVRWSRERVSFSCEVGLGTSCITARSCLIKHTVVREENFKSTLQRPNLFPQAKARAKLSRAGREHALLKSLLLLIGRAFYSSRKPLKVVILHERFRPNHATCMGPSSRRFPMQWIVRIQSQPHNPNTSSNHAARGQNSPPPPARHCGGYHDPLHFGGNGVDSFHGHDEIYFETSPKVREYELRSVLKGSSTQKKLSIDSLILISPKSEKGDNSKKKKGTGLQDSSIGLRSMKNQEFDIHQTAFRPNFVECSKFDELDRLSSNCASSAQRNSELDEKS
ncbi:hypothetical protein KSP39_PZI019468 [Platanthera zijinensis]|uniref:Uncharacterized protein n=1 Tax=Platanthera zijinensis TaxID=2320716 RepID=A0AAP0FXY5_9ASPA